MKRIAVLIAMTLAGGIAMPALAGLESKCAPLGLLGGYRQHDLGNGLWRISVLGNGMAGREFVRTCTLGRASAIAAEQGYPRFAVVSFKATMGAFKSSGTYARGSGKAVIKLLRPGESAEPIQIDRVLYFDASSGRAQREASFLAMPDEAASLD